VVIVKVMNVDKASGVRGQTVTIYIYIYKHGMFVTYIDIQKFGDSMIFLLLFCKDAYNWLVEINDIYYVTKDFCFK